MGDLKALLITYLKNVPIKKRNARANQASFIDGKIHKEIMRRTYLRNESMDFKTDADRIIYNKQRKDCVSLIPKKKRVTLHFL